MRGNIKHTKRSGVLSHIRFWVKIFILLVKNGFSFQAVLEELYDRVCKSRRELWLAKCGRIPPVK